MIAIVKGCGNNVASVQYALQRLGVDSVLTDDPETIVQATRVILPGVGHAKAAMQQLRQRGLDQLITQLTQPVLGICLGMQLLYEYSEEGNTRCLGVIPGQVRKLQVDAKRRVPHMGWNRMSFVRATLNQNFSNDEYVYFVHSYAAELSEHTLAVTEYGRPLTAIVHYRNFYGMQFHPERSARAGETLLMNFIQLESA